MKKGAYRLMAVLMVLTMAIAMLAGCTGGTPSTKAPTTGGNQGTPTTSSSEPKELKLGFISALSGGFAANGTAMQEGLLMYLEERDYILAGFKVTLFTEDDENVAETSMNKVRKLVEKDNVDIVIGVVGAAGALAVGEYCVEQKIPYLCLASADDLTQRKYNDYVIRPCWTSSQTQHPFGEWAYDELGIRKVVTIAYDFAFGHEVVAGFHRTFQEKGGTIVKKIWSPMNTNDYAPYLAQINKNEIDAVFCNFSGADAQRFLKQYKDFGFGDVPLLGGANTTDEHILPQMGDEAIGVYSSMHWSAALDTPQTKKFVDEYTAKYNRIPSYYSDSAYTGAAYLEAGLKGANGWSDIAKFAQAMRETVIDSARGPVSLDEYNNPIQNVYIRRVEKVNGQLQNTVIDTFEQVSQFWTYGAAEFLKSPVYSREFPPIA